MDKITHGRTCVYNVNYHVVWSVKYRRKVLTPEIESFLKDVLFDVAAEKGFFIADVEIGEMDHVYIFISAPPKVTPSYAVKMLKGISARRVFIKFPEIKNKLWKGRLWNSSYYIETIGSISEDAVKKYIEKQKTKG